MPRVEPSVWARWQWKDTGLGRWHAIADRATAETNIGRRIEVVRLACGRIRTLPQVTAPRPDDKDCCDSCRELDNLRLSYHGQPVKEREPVLALARKEFTHGEAE